MKAGIQDSHSLPSHYDCCPTFNAIYQGPQIVGRDIFHSGSRHNKNYILNLPFSLDRINATM